jgi:hypothetical protein
MDWSRSTVTSSVLGLASVRQEPLLAHVVVERRQSALSVKSYRKELWFETPGHRAFLNITGNFRTSNTELHDLRFPVGETIPDCYEGPCHANGSAHPVDG